MFQPLYRPSSGCTLSCYKANCTINSVFVFVDEISFYRSVEVCRCERDLVDKNKNNVYCIFGFIKKVYNLMMTDIEVETYSC